MGNMLPRGVQATSTNNSKLQSCHSFKLLLITMKKKRCHCKNMAKAETKHQQPAAAAQRRARKKGGVVRVKVVLTREEAARLLSLTVRGKKTAAQVVGELRRMQQAAARPPWRPALESIPEEC